MISPSTGLSFVRPCRSDFSRMTAQHLPIGTKMVVKLSKIVLCGFALLGLSGLVAQATETVKVGMIMTLSGPMASLGENIDRGARLYVKEHEHDLPPDVKLDIIRRDDTGPNPDVARRLAQE